MSEHAQILETMARAVRHRPVTQEIDKDERARNADALDAGAAALRQGQWQPIETAPQRVPILLWEQETKSVNVGVWSGDRYTMNWHALVRGEEANWDDDGGTYPIFNASHWMPLPLAPPEAG